MKVKSFSIGLVQGVTEAVKSLDNRVATLGNVKIYQVTDTLYSYIDNTEKRIDGQPILVRVVLYEEKRSE